jgi:hypothetical protein
MRVALVVIATVMLAPAPAWAHPAKSTAVMLDVVDDRVGAELHVPVDQLAMALERSPGDLALPADDALLRDYLGRHLAVRTADGRPYRVELGALAIATVDDAPHLVAHMTWTPPVGARIDRLRLVDDVVLHRVVSHKILVFVRSDFAAAVFPTAPRLVDTLRFQHTALILDRGDASWARGLVATIALGARHIGEGTDHLMFLLLLLLSSVLVASGGRWRGPAPTGRALRDVIAVVTGFTLGHSLSLAAGVLIGSALPVRPVEIAIAASILVSAVHTLWPLFAGRERLVAGGFGVVHGLAFSTVLTELGFRGGALAWSLLGFNLGIELMQLAVVAVALPCLLVLGRSPGHRALRVAGGGLGVAAAVAWLVERALDVRLPGTALLDVLPDHAPWIGLGLVVITALAALPGLAQAAAPVGAADHEPAAVVAHIEDAAAERPGGAVAARRIEVPGHIPAPDPRQIGW